MKLSISLPNEDVEFVDAYGEAQGIGSRSAVVHKAIRVLRGMELGAAYEDAFAEWESSGDDAVWDRTVSDGLSGTEG